MREGSLLKDRVGTGEGTRGKGGREKEEEEEKGGPSEEYRSI